MESEASWNNVFAGRVLSVKNWSDTHISSSGGGGYVGQHGGYVAPARVHSQVVQRTELFAVNIDGEEKNFDLSGVDVSFREGSAIFVVWGSETGSSTGQYLYIENLDTRERFAANCPLKVRGSFFKSLSYGLFSGIVCLLFGFVVLFSLPVIPDKLDKNAELEARVSATIASCIPGQRTTEILFMTPYKSCARGVPASNVKKQEFWCECINANEIRARHHESKAIEKPKDSKPYSLVLFLTTSTSILVSIFVMAVVFVRSKEKNKLDAVSSRANFTKQIIKKSDALGVNFVCTDSDQLALKRIESV